MKAAVEGWFTTGDAPALLGSRCGTCETVYFPPTSGFCRNPACDGEEFEQVELSRRGRVWSYTDARYQLHRGAVRIWTADGETVHTDVLMTQAYRQRTDGEGSR